MTVFTVLSLDAICIVFVLYSDFLIFLLSEFHIEPQIVTYMIFYCFGSNQASNTMFYVICNTARLTGNCVFL